ncbi:hypothetical protein AB0B01_17190 [Streptomyces sp. NPDC044571]|uniref:hypothetical protein n=1 Tax=Streptomyces sp. NPDC044571 TaxID=3155371 RepID=UPI0033E0D4C7
MVADACGDADVGVAEGSLKCLEGLDAAARKGMHGSQPPVITDDMTSPSCVAARR